MLDVPVLRHHHFTLLKVHPSLVWKLEQVRLLENPFRGQFVFLEANLVQKVNEIVQASLVLGQLLLYLLLFLGRCSGNRRFGKRRVLPLLVNVNVLFPRVLQEILVRVRRCLTHLSLLSLLSNQCSPFFVLWIRINVNLVENIARKYRVYKNSALRDVLLRFLHLQITRRVIVLIPKVRDSVQVVLHSFESILFVVRDVRHLLSNLISELVRVIKHSYSDHYLLVRKSCDDLLDYFVLGVFKLTLNRVFCNCFAIARRSWHFGRRWGSFVWGFT